MEPTAPQDDEKPEPSVGAGFDFADPHSPLAVVYLRGVHIAAVAVFASVFTFLSYMSVWHTDVWGHLRFGEYMVQEGKFPEREMFSGDFADQDALYVNFQWLAQAGAYLVFDLGRRLASPWAEARLGGGALFLSATHAAIITLRLIVLLFVFRRLTGSLRAALFGVVLVCGIGLICHYRILRPQILGELAFAILLLPLSRPLLSRRALVLIPLLFVVWGNTHGSFLMGFVLLGIFLVGHAVEVLRAQGLSLHALLRDTQSRRLAGVLAASAAAVALLNPHGPALYLHLWKLAQHPNLASLEEWKPLPLQEVSGFVFLASVVALVSVLRWSKAPLTATQFLLVLAFGWQTLAHARVMVWWILVFAWVFVPHFHALCRRWNLFFTDDTDQLNLRKTIMAGMLAIVLLLWSAPAQWLVWGDAPTGARWVTKVTPVRVVDYLKRQYRDHPDLPRCVFTSETVGEYILWDLRLTPPVRVFCYTHVHLITEQHWQECLRVKNADPGWQEILDRHGVAFLIVEPDLHPRLAAQVRAAPERWEIVRDPDLTPLLVARRLADKPS